MPRRALSNPPCKVVHGMHAASKPPVLPRSAELFTPRELQVLRLLVAGETHQRVATLLKIEDSTVHGHALHIARKLGSRTPCEMGYKFAMIEGVFQPRFVVREGEGRPDEDVLLLARDTA